MGLWRPLSISVGLVGLGGLVCIGLLVVDVPPGDLLRLGLALYCGNVLVTIVTARAGRRSLVGWTAASLLLPFITPFWLGSLPALAKGAMASADVAWSRLGTANNPMEITGVLLFEQPIVMDALRALLEQRLLVFDRFKQRVVHGYGAHRWVNSPGFDIDDHLELLPRPGDGGQEALQQLAGEVMSSSLDHTRPLWKMYLVEGCGSGCALIVRIHHCIADGVALIKVLLSLTDEQPSDENVAAPETSAKKKTPPARASAKWKKGNVRGQPRGIGQAFGFVHRLLVALGRVTFLPPDSSTLFKGSMTGRKRAAWSRPVPVQTVKELGHRMGGKINDVALAALTGALRRYMQSRGATTKGVKVRMMIPVDIRPFEEGITLGNRFGLVFLTLPLEIEDPAARLTEVIRRMERLKSSLEPLVTFLILKVLGKLPHRLQDLVAMFFTLKATGVMTNVPGPRMTLYMGDAPMQQMMFWVPQSWYLTMGLSIMSYDGQILLGVTTDDELVKNPEALVAGFNEEIEQLEALAEEHPESSAAS